MRLFRLKGKHDDPNAERELVLDTGTADDSTPEAQSPPEPEPAPAAPDEAAAEIPSSQEEGPVPQDNFLAEISAQADKEMAEQEQLAAGASSQGDDALDPGLLDIFRDAKSEVEESSLAAELESISAREILDEIRGIGQRLGIPSGRLRRSHDDKAGQLAADAAQRQAEHGEPDAETGGPDTEGAQPQAEVGGVQADEGAGAEVPQERPPLTQAH